MEIEDKIIEDKINATMADYSRLMDAASVIYKFAGQLFGEYKKWYFTTDSEDRSANKFIEQRFPNAAF